MFIFYGIILRSFLVPKLDHSSLDKFAASLRLKASSLLPSSPIDAMLHDFWIICRPRNFQPLQLNQKTLIAYSKHLSENNAEKINSVRRTIIGVRQFYRFLEDEKILQQSPFEEVPIPERSEKLPGYPYAL